MRLHPGFSMDHPEGLFESRLSDFVLFLKPVSSEPSSFFRLARSAFACLLTLHSSLPEWSCWSDPLSGIKVVAKWSALAKISLLAGSFSYGDGCGVGLGRGMEKHIPVPVLDGQHPWFVLRCLSYLGRSADRSRGFLLMSSLVI